MIPITTVLYGFARTTCACDACTAYCHHLSGMVAPADLARWQVEHGLDFPAWAAQHLAASPGAIVLLPTGLQRIPTIVPARQADGRCHWLTPEDRCAIHATAPYGCAYFDCRQSPAEGNDRSAACLAAILADLDAHGPYQRLWRHLARMGRTVQAPEQVRLAWETGEAQP